MEKSYFINERKDLYTRILCDLIRAKTVNPPGNEFLAAKIVKKRLSKIGIKYKSYEKNRNRENIIAMIGPKTGASIILCTHLDVVPAGDGWITDPFEPVIKDGVIYGRGVSDDKGQIACVLLVADFLKTIEKSLKNQYIFVFGADEEKGSSNGLKYLLDTGILYGDMGIVVDVAGGSKKVTVAEKGVLRLRIVCKGKEAHGATPRKGISAIVNMSKFIARLEHHVLKHFLHKYLTRPTINCGIINGGSAENIVAGRCELLADIRYLPSQTPENIVFELKKISERFGDFDFEIVLDIPPTEVDEKGILVQTIIKSAENNGIVARPAGLSGATDAKALIIKKIPTVGFDFASDFIAHTANESCNLSDLFRFCNILVDVCLELEKTDIPKKVV